MAALALLITEESFVPDYLQKADEPDDASLYDAFRNDRYKALYDLAFFSGRLDSPSLIFLRALSELFIDGLLHVPELELLRDKAMADIADDDILSLLDDAPYMIGSSFLSIRWARLQLERLREVYARDITSFTGSVDLYFSGKRKDLVVPSRVFFHLVEYPEGAKPFAFMATYSTLGDDGKVRHYPLRYARTEYGNDKEKLASLVAAIRRISSESRFIASLVDSGDIFYPLMLDADEAYSFLHDVPLYEAAGIICRVPPWWKNRRGSMIELGVRNGGYFSRSVLLTLVPDMVYEGLRISEEEARALLSEAEGLRFYKGRWIEVDHKRLRALVSDFERLKGRKADPVSLIRAESGLAGSDVTAPVRFSSRGWIAECASSVLKDRTIPRSFNGTLRGYQEEGYLWLTAMARMGLGVCLADDMGLGKTVEMLAFLLRMKEEGTKSVLLIVPLSLLSNWEHEIRRFAPSLDYLILYGKNRSRDDFPFLTVSTYQMATKNKAVVDKEWDIIVLDEAQAIKNAGTAQSKRIKALKKGVGIAMTGTPIENDLMNLHSIFSFLSPGLLGSAESFRRLVRDDGRVRFSGIRRAISPFILRRVKTDRSIIHDLPEKLETDVMVSLGKEQIVLYREIVSELEEGPSSFSSFEEKGMLLRTLLRLKQVCNHPAQLLGDGDYSIERSGKFLALRDLAASLAENRERVLVFTQFRTMIPPLDDLLFSVFGKRGLTISGETGERQRAERVELFQGGEIPYMVLSLRAAGVGLNLTAASSVIHFDRWWNPAVENQATDRAFRIGQERNVSVYRFVTADTIEERISDMLSDKQALADGVIGDASASILSRLSPDEIIAAMRFTGVLG